MCSDDLEAAKEYCVSKPELASAELTELADFITIEAGIQPPSTLDEALKLYRHLRAD